MLNQAMAAPSTTRGALAKDRLSMPGAACTQAQRQAGRQGAPCPLLPRKPLRGRCNRAYREGLRYPSFTNMSQQALCMSWVSPAEKKISCNTAAQLPFGEERIPTGKAVPETYRHVLHPSCRRSSRGATGGAQRPGHGDPSNKS